jgi:hypothetical protein
METNDIADLIDRVMTGDPWHGSSVAAILEGVSATEAAAPGPAGTHGIWEIVLHMTGWAREVVARLSGRAAGEPEGGDWPSVGDPDATRWQEAQAALFAAHRDVSAAVRRLDAPILASPVKDFRNSELGTGLSHYLTLHGLVHHTVYHAGQIALLRRSLRGLTDD